MLTEENDVEIHALAARGWNQSAISRHTGRDRKTIRKHLVAGGVASRERAASCLEPFRGYIAARFVDDPHLPAVTLLEELTAMFDYVAWAPWRAGAVRALLALEHHKRARELADEMVGLTRRLEAPSALALALRTLARTERGTRAIELLEEAVSLFEGRPERLQHAYALVEHGAALRRAGRRGAAADPLGHGLALAERGGLRALAEQARVELAAAGGRTPRHTLGGVESLTPTERRVALLAAGDLSNREISQQLFVTIKTVEYHLGNTYRKLDVRSRTGLAGALGPTAPGLAVAHDGSQEA